MAVLRRSTATGAACALAVAAALTIAPRGRALTPPPPPRAWQSGTFHVDTEPHGRRRGTHAPPTAPSGPGDEHREGRPEAADDGLRPRDDERQEN